MPEMQARRTGRIEVAPFEVIRRGETFGLIPRPPEDPAKEILGGLRSNPATTRSTNLGTAVNTTHDFSR